MKRNLIMLALLASFRPFSGEILETVPVKIGKKVTRINRADYNEDIHGKIITGKDAEVEPAPTPTPGTEAPIPTAPVVTPPPAPTVDAFVSKKGKKWVVVDKNGQSIPGTEEYDSEDAAKTAHAALTPAPAGSAPPPAAPVA